MRKFITAAFAVSALTGAALFAPDYVPLPRPVEAALVEFRSFAFARLYGTFFLKYYEKEARAYKEEVLSKARGKVLEIGIGPGANFDYYPDEVEEIYGIEPNPYMVEELNKIMDTKMHEHEGLSDRAKHGQVTRGKFKGAIQTGAEDLSQVESNSMDTVVSTLVLCSVGDVEKSLAEIKRVLRPGGQFLFVEHVKAKESPYNKIQKCIENPWKTIGDGCHLTRDTGSLIKQAGFANADITDFNINEGFFGGLLPHIRGVAVKGEE